MTCIHGNEVNKIAEQNVLHDIINLSKRTKFLNSYYSPIMHGRMNTRKGRAKFKNFRILLDSECSTTIVMGRLVRKVTPKEDVGMKLHTQAGSITTNIKLRIDFT